MHAAIETSSEFDRAQSATQAQRERIVRLMKDGDREAGLANYPKATCAYYTIFQPDIWSTPATGLRRVADTALYEKAARKLRVVASRYADQLVQRRCLLAGESTSGIAGVPRGALNLYLISNQYDVFTDRALQYAAEESGERDIKRFLVSSVRARLDRLRKIRDCAYLLDEEQEAFPKLADFEVKLRLHLACNARNR